MASDNLVIEDFQIDQSALLGRGQYGEVFECKSLKLPNIQLCAKILKNCPHLKEHQESEKQISTIIAQNKDNPNIVKTFFVKDLGETLILIMEKCDTNLQNIWEQKKQFSDEEIQDFLIQFLNGYELLYRSQIIHRDIKPENILVKVVNGRNIYKIADFGIAKQYKANDFLVQKVGTPAYAAPEINSCIDDEELVKRFISFKNVENAKSTIDLFSLGLILYQMIFGYLPYNKNNQLVTKDHIRIFLQQIKQEPLKIPNTQSKIAVIVEKILAYYPEDRMQFKFLYENFEQSNLRSREPSNFLPKPIIQNQPQIINIPKFNPPQQYMNPPQQQMSRIQTIPKPILKNPTINPMEVIKQYINFILNDLQGLLNDKQKKIFQEFYQFNRGCFSQNDLLGLIKTFGFKLDKLNSYESKTLKFLHSIFIQLSSPNQTNIEVMDDQSQRQLIRDIWTKYIDLKLL